MRPRLLTIIVLLGIPLLAVGMAAPVSAQTMPTIDITSATLVAKGAAVDVSVTVTCEAGASGSVGTTITQRSGNTVMQGSGSTSFVCTGEPQTVTVRTVAEVGGPPFKSGEAVAHAFANACGEFGCEFASTDETIRIGK